MFTGIVDHCGLVESAERRCDSFRLRISSRFPDLTEGESIAVDGICLTALNPLAGRFECDLSPETLALTRAAGLTAGRRVNLERALRLSDRLGGHLVTGHVDSRCEVRLVEPQGEFLRVVVGGLGPDMMRHLGRKGSVALLGVSLTVNALTDDGFDILLIPHTLERTNLTELSTGDVAHVELDWMVKVVLRDADARRENAFSYR